MRGAIGQGMPCLGIKKGPAHGTHAGPIRSRYLIAFKASVLTVPS